MENEIMELRKLVSEYRELVIEGRLTEAGRVLNEMMEIDLRGDKVE